jgi:3-keto-5-aminohexanoate cleavage enzyme
MTIMTTAPLTINLVPTGSTPRKTTNPNVPVTPHEIVHDLVTCFDAGATSMHIHVRDKDQNQTLDPALFKQVQDKTRVSCPQAILIFSTSSKTVEHMDRTAHLYENPEMCSYSVGNCLFPTGEFVNPWNEAVRVAGVIRELGIIAEIEIFSEGMLGSALKAINAGLLKPPYHFNFILGIDSPDGIPCTEHKLRELLGRIKQQIPSESQWCWGVGGCKEEQFKAIAMGIRLGASWVRAGLEDQYMMNSSDTNLGLIKRTVELSEAHGRPVATPIEARAMYGLCGE